MVVWRSATPQIGDVVNKEIKSREIMEFGRVAAGACKLSSLLGGWHRLPNW